MVEMSNPPGDGLRPRVVRRYFVQDLPRPAQEYLPRVLVGKGQGLADQNPV